MSPIEIALAALPAAVTGLFGYLAARLQFRRRPGDASDTIASAFSKLVNELQEENARHMASIRILREDAHKMHGQLTRLEGFAQSLFRHIAVLERQIAGLGAEPVARPSLADVG
jgi:hypothetical protein